MTSDSTAPILARRERRAGAERSILAGALLAASLLLPVSVVAEAPRIELAVASEEQAGVLPEQEAEPSLAGQFLAGLIAGQGRDLSAAAEFMRGALALDPENLSLLQRAFVLTAASGQAEEAVRLAKELLSRVPDEAAARLVLVADALLVERYAEARALAEGIPDQGLGSIVGPLASAWALVGLQETGDALSAVAKLRATSGLEVMESLNRAMILDFADRDTEAAEAYDESYASSGVGSLRLALIYGNFLERQERTEEARKVYQDFASDGRDAELIAPSLQRLESGRRPKPFIVSAQAGFAESLFNLGNLLRQERAEEAALVYAHLALRLNPELTVARILLGEILQDQDRGEEAIAVYRTIEDTSPFAWNARLNIAEELDRLDRVDDAKAELEAMAAQRPKRYEPMLTLGNLMRARERFEEAAVAYDEAIRRLGAVEAHQWALLYFRGIALERSGEWARAEQDFLRALELEPEQPFVMNYLAYSWVEQKEHLDEAEEMLRRAVELRPSDGYIVDSLGWVYYRLGKFEKAVVSLERAVQLRPQDPVINDHLGDAYWQVGRKMEARFQWRRALSFEPEAEIIPDIEAKIERGLEAASPSKL